MMSAPMSLIWVIDIIGSSLMIILSIYALKLMRDIYIKKPGITLYFFLYAQTIALAIFALSRSIGHIVKRILITAGQPDIWEILSPISGSINSVTFVIFGLTALLYSNVKATSERVDVLEKSRRELKESEEKYRSLTETANDAIFIADAETGILLDANKKAEELIGMPAEKIIGMSHSKLYPEEEAEDYIKIFQEHAQSGKGISGVFFVSHKDGRKIPVEISASITEVGGKKIIQSIFRDITERKRAEEALRKRAKQALRHQTALLELAKMDLSDLDSTLKRITEVDSKTLGVDRVSIWLFNEDRSEVIAEDLYKVSEDVHERGLKLQAKQYPRYFQALEESRIIAADDARSDPRTNEFTEGYLKPLGITSMMDVPVWHHGEVFGIVCHEHSGPKRKWTPEEQDFGTSIADMVSLAFEASERKRAEEEVKNRTADLKIINNIIRDVSSTIDLEEVLHRITKSAAELINGDAATIAVFDEEKGVVTYPYHYNMPDKLKKVVVRKGQGLAGQVIETKKPVIVKEYPSHPRAVREFVDAGLKVLSVVPLISKGKAFGALGVFGLTKETRFSKHDLELLEAVGKEAAVAIENARLYQEIKGFSETLEKKVKERTADLEEAQKALVVLLEDVNQTKEELEEANIQLQELDRLKSMFIASMSHELRTPLNSIIGFTGIILQGMSGEITKEQRKQLTMVMNSAKHLLNLINDIIDLSKVEAGKVELAIEEFDLSSLVQEVKDSFTVALEEKGLKISLKMPERLLVKSDERRTKQVLVNLVSNAVKFTDSGEIEIKAAKKDGMAEVSVSDTGIGIKKEEMNRLFKAFSQVPVEGRPKEGTGLGLYLSKKIAELLGGRIWAESEFGKGSVFKFAFPLKYREVKT